MSSAVVRKKGVAVKMRKSDIGANGVVEKVAVFLQEHDDDAYTVGGLMIEGYNVDPQDIKGSWSLWEKAHSTLYGRITRALEQLEQEGKVVRFKKGNAHFWGRK